MTWTNDLAAFLTGAPVALRDLARPAAAHDVLAATTAVFLLFLAAKVGEEIARRLGQPAVVGELLGGFAVGPNLLGWTRPDEVALVLAELGVVILLFRVGLEARADELLAVGRTASTVAVLAMLMPILAGAAVMLATGETPGTSLIVGLALAATSIGVTSRVLADMGVLDRAFSRVILGAAIVDDVLVLILIGVVQGAVTGDLSASTFLVAVASVGLVVLGFATARRARGLPREAFTWPLFADTPLVPAFLLMLAAALTAAWIGLAAIIGSFVAGLIMAETEAQEELERDIAPLAAIFVPFYFAVTGQQIDLGMLLEPGLAQLAVILAAVGIATKLAGGALGAGGLGRSSALVVGAGMVPRGEVGIVVANLGLAAGLLSAALFSTVLVAVVLTTVVAPLLLSPLVRRAKVDG